MFKHTHLSLLPSPNSPPLIHTVLRLIGICTEVDPWFLVTELCELGDLRNALQKCAEAEVILGPEEKLRVCLQIASGISYLAQLQVCVYVFERDRVWQ